MKDAYTFDLDADGLDAAFERMRAAYERIFARCGAEKVVAELEGAGVQDVLYDDRDERPGVKLKDADLIGIPLRIGISLRGLADGTVEWKLRSEPTSERVALSDVTERARQWLSHFNPRG